MAKSKVGNPFYKVEKGSDYFKEDACVQTGYISSEGFSQAPFTIRLPLPENTGKIRMEIGNKVKEISSERFLGTLFKEFPELATDYLEAVLGGAGKDTTINMTSEDTLEVTFTMKFGSKKCQKTSAKK